jgi:hypothetical protein
MPEDLSAPATVGYVLEAVGNDRRECSEKHNIERDKLWKSVGDSEDKIQRLSSKIDRIYGAMGLLTVLIAILAPVCYFALKQLIVEELDKRFPNIVSKQYQSKQDEPKRGQSPINFGDLAPWSVVPTAHANSK